MKRSNSRAVATLSRPLHFPAITEGRCPASRGRYLVTPLARGVALGSGLVRVFINNAGDLRHGSAHLASTEFPEWQALKTHFFTSPAYQGPFLVRAKRLDDPGPISLGATPAQAAPLVVPSGPAANGMAGWREFPYSTFVKTPGCYAWQVDGRTFSEIIVVRMLPKASGLIVCRNACGRAAGARSSRLARGGRSLEAAHE